MTPKEMTEISNKRLMAAFNLETPDRIPIYMAGQGSFRYIDPKLKMADFFRNPKYMDECLIEAAKLPILCEMDQAPWAGFMSETLLKCAGSSIFAGVKIPGIDLDEDALWNFNETGPMTEADYDTIIDKGWEFTTQELYKRMGFAPASMPPPDMEYLGQLGAKVAELGKNNLAVWVIPPIPGFEVLSGARRMNHFFRDLRRIPDKVAAAMKIVDDAIVENTVKAVSAYPGGEYVLIGGTRAGSSFISSAAFERFYFPFYQKIVPALKKLNRRAWLHMDNDWTGFLHYFQEFEKTSCIWDPDHMTDILKVKEVLGDKFCITGNVPPSLLSIGTPDQCYAFAKKQCADMGKSGYIMSPACTVPVDAKQKNIEAVISATLDS